MIDNYFRALQGAIAAAPFVTAANLHTERRSETIGFVRGDLTFQDGSRFHFREFVRQIEGEPSERYTYVYHFQQPDGRMIFRYDNTNHYPSLENAPHHKHLGLGKVIPSNVPNLTSVLEEIGENFS